MFTQTPSDTIYSFIGMRWQSLRRGYKPLRGNLGNGVEVSRMFWVSVGDVRDSLGLLVILGGRL